MSWIGRARPSANLPGSMKNGTNRAVLVSELLTIDGPFVAVAEDFVLGRCTRCGEDAGDDVFFVADGFLCGPCARAVAG